MAKAIKVETSNGKSAYIMLEAIDFIMEEDAGLGVAIGGRHISIIGADLDDLAELAWGEGKDVPKRRSRRNLPKGTMVGDIAGPPEGVKDKVADETPVRDEISEHI